MLDKRTAYLALIVTGTLLFVVGCGGDDFADGPRPAVGVELTGVIQDRGVSVSPNGVRSKVGAGPVLITISNQTNKSRTITLSGDSVDETVGPVQPRDTATIQKTLAPGQYEVRAGSPRAVAHELTPAELKIGPKRPSSNDRVGLP